MSGVATMQRARPQMLLFSYHRSGTTLLRQVMTGVAEALGLSLSNQPGMVSAIDPDPDIVLLPHSLLDCEPARTFRAVRLVRDPRDIWVSSYLHHLLGDETWWRNTDFDPAPPIGCPRVDVSVQHRSEDWKRSYLAALGGKSYQQNLLQRDRNDGLRFELAHCTAWTLQAMCDWRLRTPAVLELKLEAIAQDFIRCMLDMFRHLGLSEAECEVALLVAASQDLARMAGSGIAADQHIHSREISKWRNVLAVEQVADFERLHGDLIANLGYTPAVSADDLVPRPAGSAGQGSMLDEAAKDRIRAASCRDRFWPPELNAARQRWNDLASVLDPRELARQAAQVQRDRTICVTFLSQELLGVGIYWLAAMQRLKLQNVLVIAGDEPTRAALAARGVACVRADLGAGGGDASFSSAGGFTWKGLAMCTLRFPVVRFLLTQGCDVFMSDADALWLQDPLLHCRGLADIAFQRACYFPAPLVQAWGFTVCNGFVYWRAASSTIAFLDSCLDESRRIQDDQIALNLALVEADAVWPHLLPGTAASAEGPDAALEDIRASFVTMARRPLRGWTRRFGLDLLALPHHQFWRHTLVPATFAEMVVCHPNSPKDEPGKIKTFNAMEIRYTINPITPDQGVRPQGG